MNENYWKLEDGLWYYYDANWTVRYKLDFENKSVIEQYNLMDEWEDGNPVSFVLFPPTLEGAKLAVEDELKTKQREEKEFYQSMWAEVAEEENKRLQERDSWKEKLKGLINTKRFWREMEEDYDSWWIEGIVEIEPTGKSKEGYPNSVCARIKGEKGYTYTDYIGKGIFNWQTVGIMGDDYSGYTLYPLKDGRYLKVSYSC